MMNRLIVLLLIIIYSLTTTVSCKWDFEPDENPLTELLILLPETQKNVVSFIHKEPSIYAGVFMQQVSGVSGSMLDVEKYSVTNSSFDDTWSLFYLGVFSNLKTIIEKAEENSYWKFSAIAKILMANSMGVATDLWGAIPFSTNFFSNEVSFAPEYDDQELIYSQIFTFLDEAITTLNDHSSQFHPENDDIFFSGNVQSWIKYANFLKLRYKLHLTGLQGFEDFESLLDNDLFSSMGEALSISYNSNIGVNPRAYYLALYPDQVRASGYLVDLLASQNDPRLPAFFKRNSNNAYIGSNPGDADGNASLLSDSIRFSNSRIILGSYTEQMFIEAEYYFRQGNQSKSLIAFSEAVKSSLYDYSVYNDFWVQSYLDGIELSLEIIIQAKHTALFLNPEVWNDWKRTGYPIIESSVGNVTSGVIPRRFLYPQTELLYNSNNVPQGVQVTDRVWWDVL